MVNNQAMELGEYLRELRLRKRLTLLKVNRLTGISMGYLSMLEHGDRTSPHPNILRKLAKIYEIGEEMLLEKAGFISKPFSDEDDIRWAFEAVLRSPEFRKYINIGEAKFMPLELKIKWIRAYEHMTGKKLLQ